VPDEHASSWQASAVPTEAPNTDRAARYLYLARHGEASADETALTEKGRRQSVLLGERLRSTPLSAIHHGPLSRAEQTARHLTADLHWTGIPPGLQV
jgi:broad specificity phosphatase PhoE